MSLTDTLCLACGLCCDGVLFKDVRLQRGDDPVRLTGLGLPLEPWRATRRFAQPCAAVGPDCRCHIYSDRPARCRDFECGVFKAVRSGKLDVATALRTIRVARQRAEKVRALLRALGDTDERVALSVRFRRTKKRVEASALDEETAEIFSRLTLAVHDLNLLLREAFYETPKPTDGSAGAQTGRRSTRQAGW